MNSYRKTLALVIFAGLFIFPARAWAYLDPGTGSFILQMVVGALLGGLVAVGLFWRRLLGWLRRVFSRGGKDDGSRTD